MHILFNNELWYNIVNNTNISARKCCYLDLTISIYQGKFRVTLYDKRKDYNFKVITYPFLDGNVPNNLSYGIFISQGKFDA